MYDFHEQYRERLHEDLGRNFFVAAVVRMAVPERVGGIDFLENKS
jgi:hypothetical protein